ncbi:MAG: SemiSWEET transporter [Pseudomonadota bacterium]
MIDFVGTMAACLTTLAFVPQVYKIWTSKNARDISLPMYVCFTAGVVLWLIYGVLIVSAPIIIANIITLVMASAVIVMKVRWG